MTTEFHTLTVICRDPPIKRNSKAYEKHREAQNRRGRRLGPYFDYVNSFFNKFPRFQKRKELFLLAKTLEPTINRKIDRDACRIRESLICWFTENWTLMSDIIMKTIDKLPPSSPIPKISIETTEIKPEEAQ